MRMVVHKHPCVTGGLGLGQEFSQAFQHILPIFIVHEDFSTLDPPDHDVVQHTGPRPGELVRACLLVSSKLRILSTYFLTALSWNGCHKQRKKMLDKQKM